jgi:hypothetical protein
MAASELTPIIVTRATGLTYEGINVGNSNTVDFDSDTGFYIDIGDTTQANDASRMILMIAMADSRTTAGGIKIVSSTNNPYTGSGISDLALNMDTAEDTSALDLDTASTAQVPVSVFGPIETARFKDTDGYINVEYDTDHASPGCTLKALAFIVQ